MDQRKNPLTTPQKNIWNLQKYYPDTGISNLCGAVFYKETRREDLLEQAINHVLSSQTGLRLRFSEEGGQPGQTVKEYAYETIPVRDFLTHKDFEDYASSMASAPCGLTDKAMYCFEIVRIGENTGVLALLNHLISDAWTFSLIGKAIDEAYRKLENGQKPDLESYDYTDYVKSEASYRESSKYGKDQEFWQEKYQSKPELAQMKYFSPRAVSITAGRYSRKLNKAFGVKISGFLKETGITEAVLFETALGIYLARLNPENKTITMGVPVLNRRNAREKHMMGMFVSTLPLTVEASREEKAIDLAKRIAGEHRNLFRHQKYPYSEILENIRRKHDFSGNLYDAMVSYQNAQIDEDSDTQWFPNGYCETPFVLHIDNRDKGDTFTVTVDYQTEVFDREGEISLIVDRLEYILRQIMENKDISIKEISLVPQAERQKILTDFNNTFVDYENGKCVHQLFMEQAERTPERTALVFENETFSYRQLDQMSDSLAFLLRKEGIGPGAIVAILAKRSWHVIAAMLGVLKAGGAYMPVSPDYPEARIEHMLQVSKAALVLQYGYERTLSAKTWDLGKIDFSCPGPRPEDFSSPADLCYVIFTSGSTGEPKGISLRHANVVNYADKNRYNLVCHELAESGYQRMVSVTNIIFDIFVTESLLPLLYGMTVYFANDSQVYQQARLSRLICEGQVEVIQTTPSKMRSYLGDEENLDYLKWLKCIILGGEALPKDLFEKLRKHTKARIFNIYGPAETTVWSSNKEVIDGSDITIGKPVANTQIYILDQQCRLMPIGIPGELCIAGNGVGKGYLNQPELTAERFVPNPFAAEKSGYGTMYRTGDLACWREDGELQYLGRIDTQVKIRGLRIELGEIENAMSSFPGIIMTAAAKQEQHNRQYLVGYYTAKGEIDKGELRRHLSFKLPKYMMPNYFISLDRMPMTASGKTDRKKLPWPAMDAKAEEIREYDAPESETEKTVSAIWQEVMQVGPIGRKDDFWELGGDSLMAIEVLNQIEARLQTEISVKDIVENPVLEQLAFVIENSRGLRRIAVHGKQKYVLLPQQKAVYAACRKEPDKLLYNMPVKIPLPHDIEREKLKESILQVFDHHKLLKSYIWEQDNEIYGIYDESLKIQFGEYKNGEEQDFVKAFDLKTGPLTRCGFTEDAVLFDFHHIAADGESLNILLRDIAGIYQDKPLIPPPIEYSDYADYFYKLDMEKHREYFKKLLTCDFEPVPLPQVRSKGTTGGRSKSYEIPEEIFMQAKKFAKNNNLTHTMVFLGAYGILLSKYTAKKEILSSVILENRVHAETKNLVGMFANTLPIYLVMKDNMAEYMEEVKQILLNLFQFQEFPLHDIADTVGMGDKSVINTSFIYQGDGEKTLVLNGRKLKPQFIDTHTAKFDLSMELTPLTQGCRLRMEYDTAKLDEKLIDGMADAYIRILQQLENEKIPEIKILSEDERRRIIEGFNNTHVDYPKEKCIHQLFACQVQKTPDKTALVFENEPFTYQQLDEMSNSLAHFLREKGVTPNDIVPIIAKRSWHIIVAMLGVLKAGGAYMPVSPDYPIDRITYMTEIAGSKIALLYGCEKEVEIETVDLENFDFACNRLEVENINSSDDTAYIIFTSGSTGTPKGISISHRNIHNFTDKNHYNICQKELSNHCESIVSVTNIVFDIFVTESILPLLNGICIYLANDTEAVFQEELSRLFAKHRIDALQTTPTKMKSFISDKKNMDYLEKVKVIILGGEVFPRELYYQLRKYTDAAFYNIYGPAETTVWSSAGKVTGEEITIGKPIANTQIYILDKDSNPLPIGVPGELCIAGDGVGKGYLNRPELTKERFVPNPFATERNGHGAIMYRTGDLACWTEDGEIRYLGRIDTQVKIRGLRIELGEIESAMNVIEGIRISAVTDKRDSSGRQYLVGYYVSDREVAVKELRSHLGRKLPKYMIPNYFVRLDEMPMTPSGKIARKNLPEPDFFFKTTDYKEPSTEKERQLCRIAEQILNLERISTEDDFFELGGDSLKAIELVAKAHDKGMEIALQQVFDCPTIRLLCRSMEQGKTEHITYKASDFTKYRPLLERNTIDGSFPGKERPLGNVLLTGATGFLGAHILAALLKDETGAICCLVRDSQGESGQERLKKRLNYYFGNVYDKEFGKRILPVSGDMAQEEFSQKIPVEINTVIHSAASVKHYGSYEYFYKSNVLLTKQGVDFAKREGARFIHISTLSVSGNTMADEFSGYRSEKEIEFDETSFFVEQPLDNVYIRSKFEAETVVLDAMLEGVEAKIIRVGNLTNRISDFKFQPNYRENAFLMRVKAMLEFGLFPDYLLPLYSEFSPVDLTAQGVVLIARRESIACVFHLNSNRPVYFGRMMEVLNELGISMKVVSGACFNSELQKTMKDPHTEYIFEALQNDLDHDGNLVYDSNIHIKNDFTLWFLKQSGFQWDEIDREYLKGYMEYFRNLGYLEVKNEK